MKTLKTIYNKVNTLVKNNLVISFIILFVVMSYAQEGIHLLSIAHFSDNYTMKGEVVYITEVTDAGTCVSIEDTAGRIYSFYGEGFEEGDKVIVTYNNNGTIFDEEDDLIVDAQKR